MNKILGLIFILFFCCFCSLAKNPSKTTALYVIGKSPIPNTLAVHLNIPEEHSAKQLILRGVSMGISQQVKNMVCDGKPIKENKPGVWSIPENCHKLQWQVPLLEGGDVLASTQQSTKFGDFILFSEASSLPRMEGAESEILKILIPDIKTIYPSPSDPNSPALMKRFLEGADNFKNGLLIINHNVEKGDRSDYGAFYTKGIAFWMAVDKALEKQGDSLNARLQAVLQTKYDIKGEPIDLQQTLNLSPETWYSLRKSFLE